MRTLSVPGRTRQTLHALSGAAGAGARRCNVYVTIDYTPRTQPLFHNSLFTTRLYLSTSRGLVLRKRCQSGSKLLGADTVDVTRGPSHLVRTRLGISSTARYTTHRSDSSQP